MSENNTPANFIEEIIEKDLESGKYKGEVHTRFPPEPNGYLHIGHAHAVCLNFGLAEKYHGLFNLRFDDTNPDTEDVEFVSSIQEDIAWLGANWQDRLFFASNYFDVLYEKAKVLIAKGKAYIDFSTAEQIAEMKGTPTRAGTDSPYRNSTPEKNLEYFEQMRQGEFEPGQCVLRAKIDMTSPNMQLRDPIIYRIKKAHHHQTGDKWCIYPMYDYAHPLSDALEGITHSICTLEFEVHRPVYDWYLRELDMFPSQQIEFARLNLTYTIMSKRYLKRLVNEGHVKGWDDPRMPTVSGMRRRGYTPSSIREFTRRTGIAKRENISEVALLEFCVREDLNKMATRTMAVLDPLKVIITNYPAGQTEWLNAENNPEDAESGIRQVPFGAEIFIEREDFMENPPKKYFRLMPGGMVRLKHAYIIQCNEVVKDSTGHIVELRCSYIPESKSGSDTSGIHVKGTLHWVSAQHAVAAEIRLYDRLFTIETPGQQDDDFTNYINPDSLQVITGALLEPNMKDVVAGQKFQFIRKGYFCVDKDSTPDKPVFNQTVGLKDSWAKEQRKSD